MIAGDPTSVPHVVPTASLISAFGKFLISPFSSFSLAADATATKVPSVLNIVEMKKQKTTTRSVTHPASETLATSHVSDPPWNTARNDKSQKSLNIVPRDTKESFVIPLVTPVKALKIEIVTIEIRTDPLISKCLKIPMIITPIIVKIAAI